MSHPSPKHPSAAAFVRAGALLLLGVLCVLPVTARGYTSHSHDSGSGFDDLYSDPRGTWGIEPGENDSDVQFSLQLRHGDNRMIESDNWSLDQFDGLTAADLKGTKDVKFAVRRDAGAFQCSGHIDDGHGAGTFAFEADPDYAKELKKRGIGEPSSEEQFALAMSNVSYKFIDALDKYGYETPDVDGLVTMAQHGVNLKFVDGMADAGYKLKTVDALVRARDHGVSPKYVAELAKYDIKDLTIDDLVRARDHGVNGEFLAAMRAYGPMDVEDAIQLRDHGVNAAYVQAMTEAGYKGLTREQLVSARDHGVTADYVRGMKAAGYGPSDIDALRQARDHGVTAAYAQGMRDAGYDATLSELVSARDRGVSTGFATDGPFAKRVNDKLGSKASIAKLIDIREHGGMQTTSSGSSY
jgi:hypothetical protein